MPSRVACFLASRFVTLSIEAAPALREDIMSSEIVIIEASDDGHDRIESIYLRGVLLAAEIAPAAAVALPAAPDFHEILRRARAARDAAEQEERLALEALFAAREARRAAQEELDEVQATVEVWGAPGAVQEDGGWGRIAA